MLDLLVLGSGIAGLSAALRAAGDHGLSVGVLTKGSMADAATRWAQGGVAAVLGDGIDNVELHVTDTLDVAVGLGDPDAVRAMVTEGPERVMELISLGARFDRDPDGNLALGREGGHSVARVVHAGGAATGAEIERVLVDAVRRTAAQVHERVFAVELVIDGGRCAGVRAVGPDGSVSTIAAHNVLMATGGAGQMFAVTTNPAEATGDGVAMALRAGAACADVEFVQFHPTALNVDRSPRPLITEALRGDGAILRDDQGERFVDELLPRDEVSRAVTRLMLDRGLDHVWLDVTGIDDLAGHYPSIASVLASVGLDPTTQFLPVAPAAHYLCGGVLTDLDGAASIPGLWAAGEVACTGVHGANRLASNSLLEGLVFGARVAQAVAAGRKGPSATGAMAALVGGQHEAGCSHPDAAVRVVSPGVWAVEVPDLGIDPTVGCDPAIRPAVQRIMTAGAGVLRDAESLQQVAADLAALAATPGDGSLPALEAASVVTVANASVAGAAARTESRGVHWRLDHPDLDAGQCRRLVTAGVGAFDAAGVGRAG